MPPSPCVCRDMLGEFKEYMQKEHIQLPLELTVQVGALATAWCSTAAVALHRSPGFPLAWLLDHVCSHQCTCAAQRAQHHPVLTDQHKRVSLVFVEKDDPIRVVSFQDTQVIFFCVGQSKPPDEPYVMCYRGMFSHAA